MVAVAAVYVAAWVCLAFNRLAESVWRALRARDVRPCGEAPPVHRELPVVTIQLPVYNEFHVVERLIDACCSIDYPKDRLQIQVLDDSTDETTGLIARKVREYSGQGVEIAHLRRGDRAGYKAGNLQHGLASARGEFLAIFDADSVPDRDFLLKTLAYARDADVGVVFPNRVRHMNRDRSILTRAQDPFGRLTPPLPRCYTGHHFNFFFGSPGLVRKACLADVGGWQGDTLCEDEDFTIRSYLKGWRSVVVEESLASDEVSERMEDVKGQFNRWKKGNAECYRKHVFNILRSDGLAPRQKLAAFAAIHAPWFHIPVIAVITVASVPMLLGDHDGVLRQMLLALPSVLTVLWFVGIAWLRNPTLVASLLLNFGLIPRVSWAVFKGALGVRTAFVRSAKVGSAASRAVRATGLYEVRAGPSVLLEGLLALYAALGLRLAFSTGTFWLVPFHLLCVASYTFVFVLSVAEELAAARAGVPRDRRMQSEMGE